MQQSFEVHGTSLKHREVEKERHAIPLTNCPPLDFNETSQEDLGFQLISPVKQRTSARVHELKHFDFMVPYTSYPLESFQPTLPQRCFMSNPLYTFSRFKRQLLGSNIDLNASLQAAKAKNESMGRSITRSASRSKRATNNSTRTPEQTQQMYEVHYDDNHGRRPLVIALEPKEHFFESTKKRTKSNYQGPNFPFNLNYMLAHLKKKRKSIQLNPQFKSRNAEDHIRPLTCTVYKPRQNSSSRQFYTECLRISEKQPTGSQMLHLKPSTARTIEVALPVKNIKNKEVAILHKIFTRHKPSHRNSKLSLSALQ